MRNRVLRNVEGISFDVDGVDDNSAWRGRPLFNYYCNQMLCPAAVYPVVYACAVTQPLTNSDGILHLVVPRHRAV